jgi:hypothetical protein
VAVILEVPVPALAYQRGMQRPLTRMRDVAMRGFLLLAIMAGITGCFAPTGEKPLNAETKLTEDVTPPEPFDRKTALGRDSEPSVISLGIGEAFRERMASEGDELPNDVFISNTNLNGVPVAAALQAVLADTPISLTWQSGDFDDRLVTILNLSGRLDTVVSRICTAARVYCSYRNGTLELKDRETFIIEMPPIPGEAENTIASTIGMLASGENASEGGGTGGVQVDTQGGNLIYTTDMAGQQRVRQYLSQLRRGRPLIVMQLFIWEVTLSEEAESGIKWDSSNLSNFTIGNNKDVSPFITSGLANSSLTTAKGAFSSLSGNVSFGAVFSGAVNAAAVLAFLQHNGHVETVSNPQLTFVSGTSSEFTIGGERSYISGVGQLVGSTVATGGTGADTGVGSNTVQTDTIETGLKVKVNGAYEGGVIFGQLEMEDTTLLDLERIESGGTEIQLPITQERKLSTVIRLRPGDTMLMAGLRSQNSVADRRGLPTIFGLAPTSSRNEMENREMVMLLRPSIIRFTDEKVNEKIVPVSIPVSPDTPTPTPAAPLEPLDVISPIEQGIGGAPAPAAPRPEPVMLGPVTPLPVKPRDPNEVSNDSLQRTFDDVYRNATGQRYAPQQGTLTGGGQ